MQYLVLVFIVALVAVPGGLYLGEDTASDTGYYFLMELRTAGRDVLQSCREVSYHLHILTIIEVGYITYSTVPLQSPFNLVEMEIK